MKAWSLPMGPLPGRAIIDISQWEGNPRGWRGSAAGVLYKTGNYLWNTRNKHLLVCPWWCHAMVLEFKIWHVIWYNVILLLTPVYTTLYKRVYTMLYNRVLYHYWPPVQYHVIIAYSMKRLGLTHWGWDQMAAIFQTTFSTPFYWMKMFELRLNFHWNWFLRVQLKIFQHWFR